VNISLAGKVAIITGASSGIGLATVPVFLEADAKGVIGVSLPSDSPLELTRHKTQYGEHLHLVMGDVGQESTAKEFTETALKQFGRIDVLINNAGTSVVKALHEHTPQEWDMVMNTNLKAICWAARHVIPVMIRGGGGVILNTGSISGQVGIKGQGAYAASKGAVHQLTRQMAIEYAPYKIRVNAICPGTVDTPLVHRSAQASGDPEGFWAMVKKGHPIGRIASPSEVAKFFAYMASDEAGFFTGSILMIDRPVTLRAR
jgi:NAD(P)-dependent dehydrogenase (short-subunit alcohol dehydrogenase family)